MRKLRYLGLFLVCAATPAVVLATMLSPVSERLDFTSPEALKGKATWGGGSTDRPLDFTPEGLGCQAVMADNASTYAWVQTEPMALGSWGNPWYQAGFSIEIEDFVDENGFSCVRRIFVRHSPDRRHWTTWQSLGRKKTPAVLKAEDKEFERIWKKKDKASPVSALSLEAYKKRNVFVCDLAVPRAIRASYKKLLAEFAATKPPHPKFQEDAVRWILARDPHYLEKDPPFIGYVQFLIEADVGQSPRRLKSVFITGVSLVDDLMVKSPVGEDRWSFVAPP